MIPRTTFPAQNMILPKVTAVVLLLVVVLAPRSSLMSTAQEAAAISGNTQISRTEPVLISAQIDHGRVVPPSSSTTSSSSSAHANNTSDSSGLSRIGRVLRSFKTRRGADYSAVRDRAVVEVVVPAGNSSDGAKGITGQDGRGYYSWIEDGDDKKSVSKKSGNRYQSYKAGTNPLASSGDKEQLAAINPIATTGNIHASSAQHDDEPKKSSKKKTDLMSKILPMMIMPFLISTSLIPMMLTSLKFMLLKSLFVGKIAIVLLALNALWKVDNKGGVYSHNVNVGPPPHGMEKQLSMAHYGYNGDEEYGAYISRKR